MAEVLFDLEQVEIIKGHVSLGSLRVRQDYKIAKALLNGSDDPTQGEFALARIRQLGAHSGTYSWVCS